MPTQLEKSIIHARNTQGVIRPLLQELFTKPVRVETQSDIDFITAAAQKMADREKARDGSLVFSPSGLASCLRRVYLGRHWKSLGLERVSLPDIQAHGIFTEGDFRHLQYHFYMHKLDVEFGDRFVLIDIEVPVVSKRKDHGGTVDCIAYLPQHEIIVVVDYKGWNVRNFKQAIGSLPHGTRIQVVDYMMLLNSSGWKMPFEQREELESVGVDVPEKIKDAVVLAFNKGGPDRVHPLALHEFHVGLKDNLPDVRARLGVLRDHEAKEEIPEIECHSTKTAQFQGCPFAGFCLEEVRKVERRNSQGKNSAKLKVARPSGNHRSRQTRSKRRDSPT